MRAIFSYGIALIIVLGLAIWLGSGILVTGGNGPGNGERPVVALVEKDGGPLTDAVETSGINAGHEESEIDPHLTIAERNENESGGENAAPRSRCARQS